MSMREYPTRLAERDEVSRAHNTYSEKRGLKLIHHRHNLTDGLDVVHNFIAVLSLGREI